MSETEKPSEVATIGAANPFAIANLVLDQDVDWTNVNEPQQLLERTLGMPYEDLFDPAGGSPLYPGAELDADGEIHWKPVDLHEMVEDVRMENDLDVSKLKTINDIEKHTEVGDLSNQRLLKTSLVSPQRLQVELPIREVHEPLRALPMPVRELVVKSTSFDTESSGEDWEPTNVDWRDSGDFFEDVTEYSDPVQGAVGDCYLIAALAAVAWSRPYDIQGRNRPLTTETSPVSMIEFHHGRNIRRFEVSENIPVRASSNRIIYARSNDTGEVWPAIYEKAYAKWKTGTDSDKPYIPDIAGGDMVRASAELTGLDREYHSTKRLSGDELWTVVRRNSRGGKTFNPMTAWTYSTSSKAPDTIDYRDVNIAANHAYAVLGAEYDSRTETKYMVLYNPWGVSEPSSDLSRYSFIRRNVPNGSFWRSIDLGPNDGLFVINVDQFKRYYAGLGVVN